MLTSAQSTNSLNDALQAEIARYISVDVETAGPNPDHYALLSIGACRVTDLGQTFYVELQPDRPSFTIEALEVSGLSMETLAAEGQPPKKALEQFETWAEQVVPAGTSPVFVAFNAPFDWMFVNEYFHRYHHRNPFGHSALDMKAFYMGLKGVTWAATSYRNISHTYGNQGPLTHNALQDAIDQARLFLKMLEEATQ